MTGNNLDSALSGLFEGIKFVLERRQIAETFLENSLKIFRDDFSEDDLKEVRERVVNGTVDMDFANNIDLEGSNQLLEEDFDDFVNHFCNFIALIERTFIESKKRISPITDEDRKYIKQIALTKKGLKFLFFFIFKLMSGIYIKNGTPYVDEDKEIGRLADDLYEAEGLKPLDHRGFVDLIELIKDSGIYTSEHNPQQFLDESEEEKSEQENLQEVEDPWESKIIVEEGDYESQSSIHEEESEGGVGYLLKKIDVVVDREKYERMKGAVDEILEILIPGDDSTRKWLVNNFNRDFFAEKDPEDEDEPDWDQFKEEDRREYQLVYRQYVWEQKEELRNEKDESVFFQKNDFVTVKDRDKLKKNIGILLEVPTEDTFRSLVSEVQAKKKEKSSKKKKKSSKKQENPEVKLKNVFSRERLEKLANDFYEAIIYEYENRSSRHEEITSLFFVLYYIAKSIVIGKLYGRLRTYDDLGWIIENPHVTDIRDFIEKFSDAMDNS